MDPITNKTELLNAIDTYFTTPRVPRLTGAEANTILRAMVDILTSTGASLDDNGKIPVNELPNQFIINYLSGLPGFGSGKVLLSDFTWGSYSNTTIQLQTPGNLNFGTPTDSIVHIAWNTVANATEYIIQRDTTSQFLSPVNVYNGGGTTFTDTGLTANTTYYYRLRASAPNYSDSNYVAGSITTAHESGTTFALTNWPVLNFAIQDVNTIQMDTASGDGNNGTSLSANYIPAGESGFVTSQVIDFSETGETSTGALCIGPGTYLYGVANCTAAIWATEAGIVFARYNTGANYANTAAGIIGINGILRLRADTVNVYMEYSNDGTTFTILAQTPQPAEDLHVKVDISYAGGGNQRKVSNIQGNNLS